MTYQNPFACMQNCAQGECKNPTTGCQGECEIRKEQQSAEPVAWKMTQKQGEHVGIWFSDDPEAIPVYLECGATITPLCPAPTAQDRKDTSLREAVANLIKVKGRHHTEQAYQRLVGVFDAAKTDI